MKIQNVFPGVLAVMFLSTAAFGQDPPKREGLANRSGLRQLREGGGKEIAGSMAQRLPLMMALDADKDGSLSAGEVENASKALAKLDKDGDGILSPEELRPDFSEMAREGMAQLGQKGLGGAPTKEMMARMFEKQDADKDGKLTGEEIPERMRENLARVDENGDGAIEKSEMEKAMSKLAERGGQQRGAKGDKDGAGVKPKRPPTE